MRRLLLSAACVAAVGAGGYVIGSVGGSPNERLAHPGVPRSPARPSVSNFEPISLPGPVDEPAEISSGGGGSSVDAPDSSTPSSPSPSPSSTPAPSPGGGGSAGGGGSSAGGGGTESGGGGTSGDQ